MSEAPKTEEVEVVAPQMSAYEVERTMISLAKLIKHLPVELGHELKEIAADGLTSIAIDIASAHEAVKAFEIVMDKKGTEVCELCDALWAKVQKAHRLTSLRIASLPVLPEINYPYALKEIVTMAEKFSGLTDKQWSRVRDLAVALSEKEDANDGS